MDEPDPDPAALAAGSSLTARQVQVLRRREAGRTQRDIAEEFGTTPSNVSRIERAAERNIEEARRTLDVARLLRAPVRLRAPPGTPLDDVVASVYERADDAGIRVEHARPELHAHLFDRLADRLEDNALTEAVEVGITESGEVTVPGG